MMRKILTGETMRLRSGLTRRGEKMQEG